MPKMLLLAAALVMLPGLAAPAEEFSTPDQVDDEFLDEFAFLEDAGVVESSARHKQEIGMSASAITVITREDIEASGASTVPDLLRLVPGMNVIITTPIFNSITARLDWTDENNHFLVLVDGRSANIEFLGFPPFEIQPISLDDIERIEVIRGPGSFLYGANALAGVVSITTRTVGDESSGWAYLEGGEIGTIRVGARASARFGRWGVSLSGGLDLAGRFHDPRDKSGKDVWKFRAVAEYRWSENRRLLIDGGLSRGIGVVTAGLGMIETEMSMRTLRLDYQSESIRGQVYWAQLPARAELTAPIDFAGIRLAETMPMTIDGHDIDGQVQWTPPRFFDPLLVIVGGGARAAYLGSDQFLDAETYTDITSPRYHQPGISHWEGRVGAFVHAEYAPADWVTLTGDLRFDYNTITPVFLSPRLAAVFRPVPGHYLRLGAARAFRKPAFMESRLHIDVNFPTDSPITGASQDKFREFMTRGLGNANLDNEKLLSFEAGYRGEFLDRKLTISLDLFCNLYTDRIGVNEDITTTSQGLPDLDQSSFYFVNKTKSNRMIPGSELVVSYSISKNLSLLASWAYREEIESRDNKTSDGSPKHLMTLGARFGTDSGLVGSLYMFSRSKFKAGGVPNPEGLLVSTLRDPQDNVLLVLGRIGWRVVLTRSLKLEAGLKLFLPVSPFSSPHFRYNEAGGFTNLQGELFGGDLLSRMLTGYLQGSF
jgi:iron complex outermembrane receptor protein